MSSSPCSSSTQAAGDLPPVPRFLGPLRAGPGAGENPEPVVYGTVDERRKENSRCAFPWKKHWKDQHHGHRWVHVHRPGGSGLSPQRLPLDRRHLHGTADLVPSGASRLLRAGADCGITASTQATIPGLTARATPGRRAEDCIARSEELFRERPWRLVGPGGRDSAACPALLPGGRGAPGVPGPTGAIRN